MAQRWGFTGKEHQDELGLGWIDITARNYDAALGRWMNLDPLAEKFYDWSPYNYSYNSPIVFNDPDGRNPILRLIRGTRKIVSKVRKVRKLLTRKNGKRALKETRNMMLEDVVENGLEIVAPGSSDALGIIEMLGGKNIFKEGVKKLFSKVKKVFSKKAAKNVDDIPETIFRSGRTNDSAIKDVQLRPGEDSVSFREHLSNPLDGDAVMKPGKPFMAVDTKKLPPGSIDPDAGKIINGKRMPSGHVSVKATPEQIVNAIDKNKSGKFPKKPKNP